MTTTPNTPANAGKAIADIARDAAELVLKAVVAAPLASHYPSIQIEIIGSIADAIAKAIERDRAERAKEIGAATCASADLAVAEINDLQKQLAEREAELAAERVRIETQGHNVRFYADKSLALEAKLAEQSAALASAKGAIKCANKIIGTLSDRAARDYFKPDMDLIDAALAQIEALAGGKQTKE